MGRLGRFVKLNLSERTPFLYFSEDVLERDFFGQEARQEAEVCTQVGSDAESAGRGEDYGGVHKTKFEGHLIRTLHKDWI